MENNAQAPSNFHPLRLDRLDHLRALAAILVLLWHGTSAKSGVIYPFVSIAGEGYTGVSLFCAISGFIFSYLYYDAEIQYGSFLRKRVLRIAPMFIFYLTLGYYTSGLTPQDLAAVVTTTVKFGQGLPPVMSQDWTILIEFQFYLLFPFLISFARRYGLKYLVALLLFMIFVRIDVFTVQGHVQALSYWTIFGRMDQFLSGMIAGILVRKSFISPERRGIALATAVAGTAVILAFYFWFHNAGGFSRDLGPLWGPWQAIWIYLPTIEGVCYAALIAGYVTVPISWTSMPVRAASKVFSFLGRISYSIYMNQLFLSFGWWFFYEAGIIPLHWVPNDWDQTALLTLFGTVPLLALMSTATYYLLERPFLNLKR